MYTTFFGFQRPPFELVPDPDFLYLGESHEAALANVAMGLEAGKGFVVITGPVGAGKTTVLRAVLRRLARGQRVCYLSHPEMEVRDLLRAILAGFEQPTEGLDLLDMRRALSELLEGSARPGVLMIDEAHLLTEESLEQIRLLSNLEEDSRKLLQIVFSGQPELKELLSRPRLRPLTQRIEMYYEIAPLEAHETAAYIDRRIRIAGSPDGLAFEPKALELIHVITGGIPRLINILADRALITAYVAESRRITEGVIREAYADLGEVTQTVMPGAPGKRVRGRAAAAAPRGRPEPVPAVPRGPTIPPRSGSRARQRRPGAGPVPVATAAASGVGRWLAAAGIGAVALLALVSLGSGGGGVLPALAGGREAPGPPVSEIAGELAGEPLAVPGVAEGPAGTHAEDAAVRAPIAGPQPVVARRPLAIQVAAFREPIRARTYADELRRELSEPIRVSPTEAETGLWYRVLVGECATREEAYRMMDSLRRTHDFTFLRPVQLIARGDSGAPVSEDW